MEFVFVDFDWSGLPSGHLNGIIDPTYAKIIKKLEEDYNGLIDRNDVLKTRDNKRNLLRHFAEVYMMPWQFWVKFKDMNKKTIMKKNVSVLIENLKFPHCHLDKIWRLYEKNICSLPTKTMVETYQKMKELHEKLELLKGTDDDLWFATLLEVKDYDVEFIEQMTEYQIGRDLSNRKLWKLYINFLKIGNNIEKLLQTFSKYCRFYLDDNEMKEEYRKAAQKYGSSFEVPWKNPFDFEIYNENAKEQWRHPPKKALPSDNKRVKKCTVHFSPEGMSSQNFPFRDTFIHYIISTSCASLKQKFHKSCKYFFSKYPIPSIYKFIVDENSLAEEISQDSIQLSSDPYKLKHDIHISTVFTLNIKSSSNYLSAFISNIYQCEAKYIEIYNQNLTFNELKHLIGHGNVVELTLEKCVITYVDEQRVPLEDILVLTPKLEHIKMRYPKITSDTAQNILNLQFQNKFSYIMLHNVTPDLEPYTFVEFLNKNCLHDCEISLYQKESLKAGNLFKVVREELRRKWGNSGPQFSCNTLLDDFDILH